MRTDLLKTYHISDLKHMQSHYQRNKTENILSKAVNAELERRRANFIRAIGKDIQ